MTIYNIFKIAGFGLLALLFYQAFRWVTISQPDPALLRNETSYYHTINQDHHQMYWDGYYDVHSINPDNPYNQPCFQKLSHVDTLYHQFATHMSAALSGKHDLKEVNEALFRSVATIDSMKGFEEVLPPMNVDPLLYKELNSVQILRAENKMLQAYNIVIDKMREDCTAPYCGFDRIAGLITKKIGKVFIHDTIDAQIPRQMSVGARERIRISFSKKFIDALSEDQRKGKTLYYDKRSTHVVFVELLGDGLDISPFDREKKVVTASAYTVWEYDIASRAPGTKDLRLLLSVPLVDFDGNETTEKYDVPLSSIMVVSN